MIDTSDEAIEADLERAARGGTPGQISVWVAWAQVRATLAARMDGPPPKKVGRPAFSPLPTRDGSADIQIAVGPFGDSYAVPTAASWEDRVEAAARMLDLDPALLMQRLHDADGTWEDRVESAAILLALPPDVLRSVLARQGFEIPGGDPLAEPKPVVIEAPTEADPALELDIEDEGDIDDDFFTEARKARDL